MTSPPSFARKGYNIDPAFEIPVHRCRSTGAVHVIAVHLLPRPSYHPSDSSNIIRRPFGRTIAGSGLKSCHHRQRPLSISRSPSPARIARHVVHTAAATTLHHALSISRSPIPAPSARHVVRLAHAMLSTWPLLPRPSIPPQSFVPRSSVQSRRRCRRRQRHARHIFHTASAPSPFDSSTIIRPPFGRTIAVAAQLPAATATVKRRTSKPSPPTATSQSSGAGGSSCCRCHLLDIGRWGSLCGLSTLLLL